MEEKDSAFDARLLPEDDSRQENDKELQDVLVQSSPSSVSPDKDLNPGSMSEEDRQKVISDALRQEDEFLEYIMSVPGIAEGLQEKKNVATEQKPPLARSVSAASGVMTGMDHLDRLCTLMEQLGDLKMQNTKLQRRVQYLEDLKSLQEMHKELQEETRQRQQVNEQLLKSLREEQAFRRVETSAQKRRKKDDRGNLTDSCILDFIESDESATTKKQEKVRNKASSKTKLSKAKPFSGHRGRSRSIGIDELEPEDAKNRSKNQDKAHQRRSLAIVASTGGKAKVSKWTKVKEAFRWEKASTTVLHDSKSTDSGLGGIAEDNRYLRVPSISADVKDHCLSISPTDSVLSGHSSSMCSSGGHSPAHKTEDFHLPPLDTFTSSSSSEDIDLEMRFSDISQSGPRRSASSSDSRCGRPAARRHDVRRLSRCQEEDASRRSKSLDGDTNNIAKHFSGKEGVVKLSQGKSHKTPWGKVKDIIQTRKDSLKKKHRKAGSEQSNTAASSDHDEEMDITNDEDIHDFMDRGELLKPNFEDINGNKRQHCKVSTGSLGSHPLSGEPPPSTRRLTPTLTITLPSTEELRPLTNRPPPSPQTERRPLPVPEERQAYHVRSSGITGTSPPDQRRSASKWTKVKKAFLTSAPGRRDDDPSVSRGSNSGPSSPNRNSCFIYDIDPDELSSGEFADINAELGDDSAAQSPSVAPDIHEEIQRNYEELQQKLSLEFHQKLLEWERIKTTSSMSSSPSSVSRPSGVEEVLPHHDKHFRRKMEEWDKIKQHPSQSASPPKCRDSAVFQLVDEDNLSSDFRKKLQEWERIKSLPLGEIPTSPSSSHHKKRIAEWQLWRTGSNKSDGSASVVSRGHDDMHTDDFNRKSNNWERAKSSSETHDQSDSGVKTPSPGVVRKNSGGSSGSKSGSGSGGKSHPHKTKTQKEKELQWLDKELHKIEREKNRLEREREKYLEREARLEKMRRAVGSAPRQQEILIQTSTGFFRFQGISEKFTKKLYEWEKARGIGPEASTFVFLDPEYKPPSEQVVLVTDKDDEEHEEESLLSRSKSASSVTTLGVVGSGTITHQPSSLSLNDVDTLEQGDAALEENRASSEPHLRTADEIQDDDEPSAVIVDVEDVIEETAAPLPEQLSVEGHTPVYCYAPSEVTQLIDSDQEEKSHVGMTESVNTESSYKLLEENINLLNKLCDKEDIRRKLEDEIEHLEGKIDDVTKTHDEELERLRKEEEDFQLEPSGSNGQSVQRLRNRVQELEKCQESLIQEGATLKSSFKRHSEQQAAIAQNLVGKIKQLQEVNNSIIVRQHSPEKDDSEQDHNTIITRVQDLSTELLSLAEKLELELAERNRELRDLRLELRERKRIPTPRLRAGHLWYSEDGMSHSMTSLSTTDDSDFMLYKELSRIPSQLTQKVQELKEGLSYLCSISTDIAKPNKKSERLSCDDDDEESSANFVFQVYNSNRSRQTPTCASPGDVSPISVTIKPAFFKKLNTQKSEDDFCSISDNKDHSPDVSNDDKDDDKRKEEKEEMKGTNKDDGRNKITTQEETPKTNLYTRRDSKSEDNVEGNQTDDLKIYETEITDKSTYRKQKKTLKTRRITDTYVGYKNSECSSSKGKTRKKKDYSSPIDSEEEKEDRKPTYRRSISRESHEENKVATSPSQYDGERGVKIKDVKPIRAEDVAAMISEDPIVKSKTAFLIHSSNTSGGVRLINTSPANIFVPTTRKIFSPVNCDKKGKTSSVISYVISQAINDESGSTRQEDKSDVGDESNRRLRNETNGCNDSSKNQDIFENTVTLTRSRSKSSSPSQVRSEPESESSSSEYSEKEKNNLEAQVQEMSRDTSLENKTSEDTESQRIQASALPPPHSPNPSKRDLYKSVSKETAPSIRLMIAKYNQKLNEQENGAGTKTPEISGSGSCSPVAWRSPVTERRIRIQMEKYQEEVRRVLEKGVKRREVQKSASAGVIRSAETSNTFNNHQESNKLSNDGKVDENKPKSPIVQPRGILKSSSAGTIKSNGSPAPFVRLVNLDSTISENVSAVSSPEFYKAKNQKKSQTHHLTLSIPSSPELGVDQNNDSPPSRMRALKLRKAKEEFLSRGPAAQSWTSDGMTASASTSSEPPSWTDISRNPSKEEATSSGAQSRLSMESECSCDGSAVTSEQEDGILIKSASAGMINVDSNTYRKLSTENSEQVITDSKRKSKFGLSSLASRFRKVKMRKSKEKDTSKTGAVSTLCRQSLLVDLHLSKRGLSSRLSDNNHRPCTSKSCPSSPVLRRPPSKSRVDVEDRPVSCTSPKKPVIKIFKSNK